MIKELDAAAANNAAVRVVKVGPGISADRLRGVLENVLNPGSSRGASAAKRPLAPNDRTTSGKNRREDYRNRFVQRRLAIPTRFHAERANDFFS